MKKLIVFCFSVLISINFISCSNDAETDNKKAKNTPIATEIINDPKITVFVKHPKSCSSKNAACNFIEPLDVTNITIGEALSKIKAPNDGDVTITCLGYNLKTDMPNVIPIGFTIYRQLKTSNEGEWTAIAKDLTSNSSFKELA